MQGRKSGRPVDWFWDKVDKDGPIHPQLGTRCWLWTAGTNRLGYGTIHRNTYGDGLAHRFAFRLAFGEIPDGVPKLCVCHRCDNPPCVNPTHLFIGTRPDNMRDAAEKGRALGGRLRELLNQRSKLTDDQAREILRLAASTQLTMSEIGEQFGVRKQSVWKIVHRKTYAWLDD